MIETLFILLWSSGYLFVEKGLQYNSPLVFLFLRLISSLVVVLIVFFVRRLSLPRSISQLFWIMTAGILLQGCYQIFFFNALYNGISAGVLTIILGMQPIATSIVMRDKATNMQKLGLIIGLLGLTLTVYNTIGANNTSLGIISAFLCLCGITFGTILQKKYCSTIPLTTNLVIQYLTSSIFVGLICFLTEPIKINLDIHFMYSLAWMVFVISIGATYLFYLLLKRNKALKVTSLLYCVPPVTAIMDYIIFKHTLSILTIVGMSLVILSLAIINKKNSNRVAD